MKYQELDREFEKVLLRQEAKGTYFDTRAAERFYAELCALRAAGKSTPQCDLVIGMLAERPNAWLRLVDKFGYIHGKVKVNGTVTGRCTHSEPNLAQVPKQGELGKRCRELFIAPKDKPFMVGADASGLELRVFAHYLARYDNGVYADIVDNGDIHESNRVSFGLSSRDEAKRFIYAFLFGADMSRIFPSSVVVPPLPRPHVLSCVHCGEVGRSRLAIGKNQLKDNTNQSITTHFPNFINLSDAAKAAAEARGEIKALDGRIVPVTNHTALARLIQSGGAAIIKYATVKYHQICADKGLLVGIDFEQCLHIHDEVQVYARTEDIAHAVGLSFIDALESAKEYFGLRCAMTGKYKVGSNWNDTH